jgi:hypothetical protein
VKFRSWFEHLGLVGLHNINIDLSGDKHSIGEIVSFVNSRLRLDNQFERESVIKDE